MQKTIRPIFPGKRGQNPFHQSLITPRSAREHYSSEKLRNTLASFSSDLATALSTLTKEEMDIRALFCRYGKSGHHLCFVPRIVHEFVNASFEVLIRASLLLVVERESSIKLL